ncbi:MAG: MarR family winged helix-turn-helix transcriptional regulator [Anaerolineales bacterium]
MSSSEQFSRVLREWSEVFMQRSMREFKRFMEESGLTPAQIHTLMRLHFRGECGISQIGSHLGVTNAAASQMVDRLVQRGLVDRSEAPYDRRVKQLMLTDDGRALVQQSIDARQRWLEALTTSLDPEQQAAITTALILLTAAARQAESDR